MPTRPSCSASKLTVTVVGAGVIGLGIAWRLAANHLRDRKRGDDSALEGASDPDPSPPDVAMAADLHRNLWSIAREVLTQEQYMVLWLYYVEQLTPREISGVTGRSWVAIKTALHRARRALAPHVQELERMSS